MLRQRPRQIEDVQHLPARIGISTKLGFLATNQSVEADQHDVETLIVSHSPFR